MLHLWGFCPINQCIFKKTLPICLVRLPNHPLLLYFWAKGEVIIFQSKWTTMWSLLGATNFLRTCWERRGPCFLSLILASNFLSHTWFFGTRLAYEEVKLNFQIHGNFNLEVICNICYFIVPTNDHWKSFILKSSQFSKHTFEH